MTKTTRLLVGFVPALCWLVACGAKTGQPPVAPPGTGGPAAGGAAGTTNQDATGAAGNVDAAATYPVMAADGRCAQNAFARDGVCMCQDDVPTVCSAGCTDVMTDDDNCGSCDHKCGPTSTCTKGVCGQAPATVVPASAGCATMVGDLTGLSNLGLSIAVAGGTLYWADAGHGTVKSQPLAGGAVTTIATNEKAPHAIAVNGSSVYWLNWATGAPGDGGAANIVATIRKAAGAAPVDLVSATNQTGGIVGFVVSADGATVYFSSGTVVKKVAAAGGTATDVALEVKGGLPGALALDGAKIVFPTGQNGDVDVVTPVAGTVSQCGKEDPVSGEFDPKLQINCLRVGRSRGSLVLSTILAKADRAYWANGANVQANDTAPGSPLSNESLADPPSEVTAMTMAADTIYFGAGDLIGKVGVAKGATWSRVARAQKPATSIAADASKVYWSTSDCAINSTGL